MRSNIANALELSSRFGWRVFPAKPTDKSPYINGWQQRATADADEIEQLFDPFPDAMIGLLTGPINGLTILDLDRKNGVDGVQSFRSLALPCSTGQSWKHRVVASTSISELGTRSCHRQSVYCLAWI